MHLSWLKTSNLPHLPEGQHDFTDRAGLVRRWVLLPDDASGSSLLACLAFACAGKQQIEALHRLCPLAPTRPSEPGVLTFQHVTHAPQERPIWGPLKRVSGWRFADGLVSSLPVGECGPATEGTRVASPRRLVNGVGWLFAGYGPSILPHQGTDVFELGRGHRLIRFAPLFDPSARLTDPVGFLQRLHYKGAIYKRPRSRQVLTRLNQELVTFLGLAPGDWLSPDHDFQHDWHRLTGWRQRAGVMVLDVARHVLEASARLDDPFDQSGVLALDGVAGWCPPAQLPRLAKVLTRLFPGLQFFLRVRPQDRRGFPSQLLEQTLPVPAVAPRPTRVRRRTLPRGTVLLIDVDGSLPNLALMKLSRHHKNEGQRVLLARGGHVAHKASQVMASCVFAVPSSREHVFRLQKRYGTDLQLGGSGVDVRQRLPKDIESLSPDFSLYPELGDRALGFLTRGCSRKCSFCIVPVKEGRPRQVSDFDELLQGRSRLILLDDNLLAHPRAGEFLEEMVRRNLEVNFNQTLDLRLLTTETAALLRRVRCRNVAFTRPNHHFSLNEARGLDLLRRRYALMNFTRRENVEFICLYGLNTTLAEDVVRFAFLRTLPGAYVFVQEYLPLPGGPAPDRDRFFGDEAEAEIDALLRVNFTQNMKSMEKYYRWVCLEYARQRGRIHRRLVETLFRYNARQRQGGFQAKLESLCQGHSTRD